MPHGPIARLSRIAHAALDWLYPPHCYCCDEVLGAGPGLLCAECAGRMAERRLRPPLCPVCGRPQRKRAAGEAAPCLGCRNLRPSFDTARALFPYHGPAGELVKHFKFNGDYFIGPRMVHEAARAGWLPPGLREYDLVAPVPLHPIRRRERGYDQARLLGRELARISGIGLEPQALRRNRYTERQTGLPARQRWENVRGAFSAMPGRARGARVLLVDDVLTTGATAHECARVLKGAGAREVGVFTLVRALP